jgi:hypothetical protein
MELLNQSMYAEKAPMLKASQVRRLIDASGGWVQIQDVGRVQHLMDIRTGEKLGFGVHWNALMSKGLG